MTHIPLPYELIALRGAVHQRLDARLPARELAAAAATAETVADALAHAARYAAGLLLRSAEIALAAAAEEIAERAALARRVATTPPPEPAATCATPIVARLDDALTQIATARDHARRDGRTALAREIERDLIDPLTRLLLRQRHPAASPLPPAGEGQGEGT